MPGTAKRSYSRELDDIARANRALGYRPTLLLQACCAPCSSACLERLREDFRVTVYYYNPNITDAAEYEKRLSEERRLIREYNRQVEEQDFRFRRPLGEEDRRSALAAEHPELLEKMHSTEHAGQIDFLEAPYDPETFLTMTKGMEDIPEGGRRCFACYALRLRKTAEEAARRGFDYFSTTLTISPLKNADKLNEIGEQIAADIRGRYEAQKEQDAAPGTHATEGEAQAAAADDQGAAGAEKKNCGPSEEMRHLPMFLPSDFKKKNGYLRSVQLSHEFGLYRQNYCGCVYSRRQAEREGRALVAECRRSVNIQ